MNKFLMGSILFGMITSMASCVVENDDKQPETITITVVETVTVTVVETVTVTVTETATQTTSETDTQTNTNTSEDHEQCIEASLDSGYCLVWQDEFQGDNLDETKWGYERNCWGGGNNEAQCYVESNENLWLDGEYLRIQAKREDSNGPAQQDDQDGYDINDVSGSGTYTSGRIRTLGKADWTYGKIEVRAKLPFGQGTWPAIWMLPSNNTFDGIWAINGEIDIMEAVNLKVGDENSVHGTLHYGDEYPQNVYSGEEYDLPGGASPADDFHVYTIEWEEGEIRWYVDDVHFATQQSSGWYTQGDLEDPNAPFNQPFHLIINFAVGGQWAANVNDQGIDESAFPQELVVDYVRVYGCSNDLETGKGCATIGDNYVLNEGLQPPEIVEVEETDLTNTDEISLFTNELVAPLDYGSYPNDTVSLQLISEPDYGFTAQLEFLADDSAAFFFFSNTRGSSGFENLSEFDVVEFEYRIIEDPRAIKSNIYFRADCGWPCSSGSYDLGYPTLNEWQSVIIPMSDLEEAGFNSANVNTPFVIFPESGNQKGVVMQIDNVRIYKN